MLAKLRIATVSAIRRSGWMLGLVLLFGLAILLSQDLFRSPIVPFGDEAANSLRIFKAKHFQLLWGNFSRWHFHHPGPAYFYFLAAGEFLIYDLLRLTPAAFNAQIVSSMLLAFIFAAGALAILRRHFRSRTFPALAALMLALVACTVNHSLPNLMLVSVWPPAWLLGNYLFFIAAATAIGAGDLAVLPALAAGGALLAQGHASQAPFVLLISAGAGAAGLWRRRGDGNWRELARLNRTRLLASAAIVAVLAAPIVLETWVHDPDNLDAMRHYIWSSRGHFNTISQAVNFCAVSYCSLPDTERWALEPLGGQLQAAIGRNWAVGFWAIPWALTAAVFVRVRRTGAGLNLVCWSALLVTAISAAMFFVWAMKLTGEFFAFNGLFIYAIHVLGLWILCGMLTENIPDGWNRWGMAAALTALLALVLWNAPAFRNAYRGGPMIKRALERRAWIPTTGVRLQFEHDLWPFAMGVADGMERSGVPFCVASQWAFMFDPERVCRGALTWPALRVHTVSTGRPPSSVRLVETARLAVDVVPAASQSPPLRIGKFDIDDEKEGFNEPEEGLRWTRAAAHVRFRLAAPVHQSPLPSGAHHRRGVSGPPR